MNAILLIHSIEIICNSSPATFNPITDPPVSTIPVTSTPTYAPLTINPVTFLPITSAPVTSIPKASTIPSAEPSFSLCVNDDPCATSLSSKNVCEPLSTGYICRCGEGFSSIDNTKCVLSNSTNPCRDPAVCSRNSTLPYANNTCTALSSTAVSCTCSGPGWRPSPNQLQPECLPPVKQCLLGEYATGNTTTNQCIDNRNGTYSCLCGLGWQRLILNSSWEGCTRIAPACYETDHCNTFEGGPKNQCVDKADGSYTCICNATGFTTSVNKSSCIGTSVCRTDPSACSRLMSPWNNCSDVDGSSGKKVLGL